MRNHVLEVLKRTTATVAIAAMLLCGVTACSSGGSTGGKTQINYPDGSVYIGDTEYGYRSGQGELKWIDGSSYTGTWSMDHIQGDGTFTTADGISWSGDFLAARVWYSKYEVVGKGLDGMIDIMALKNQANMLYTYQVTNFLGFSEEKKMAYEGEITGDGLFTGTALIGYWNGDVFSGTVSHGKKVKGIYAFRNGDRYNGSFYKDRMSDGTYTFAGGETLTGHFDNGVPSGRMTYTAYGTEYITTWKNGTCVAIEKA